MCGRYVNAKARGDLLSYYDAVEGSEQQTAPSWNVAPTQVEPIITERLEEGGVVERRLLTARWGLVPSWAQDIKLGAKLLCTKAAAQVVLVPDRLAIWQCWSEFATFIMAEYGRPRT
ncbi:SOS response-associated peptidase family protein [Arthrobacter sp. M4]|uniref:SOS response-associated peptidase family protein n=1 Tax=Arthrobacter sp. M4 TaxID=218160 RepID=UPI001CDD18C6|nr:SOS response-associated peptidase family protein [Arthrobacter sp. M4]MCA4135317.1 SOS response-associated peptidase [Arthrobacter sp. M4]